MTSFLLSHIIQTPTLTVELILRIDHAISKKKDLRSSDLDNKPLALRYPSQHILRLYHFYQ